MMLMMKVTLMVAFLGFVQYTSSKPDMIAVRNQKTSDIQGLKSNLNKRSLLSRKGRSYWKDGCYHCIEWWVDSGSDDYDEMKDKVDENCFSSIDYKDLQHDPFCSIEKQEPECYNCIADWVRADFDSADFDADYEKRQGNIEENCFKGANPPDKYESSAHYKGSKPLCSKANMKSSWSLTLMIVCSVLKSIL